MRNFILAITFTLVIMVTTPITKTKAVQDQPKPIKRQSIIKPLEARVYAQKQEVAKVPVQAPKVPPVASTAVSGDSDKAFIYAHESGNNPGAINRSSGACGLGQALPCSKMGCSLSDYACQDAFFTRYMLGRYGSWANARAFWQAHRWW